MPIFPKGAKDAMTPIGQVLLILAGCMLMIAVAVFAFKTWVLYSWPRTTGTVINSHVTRMTSDDGTPICSAAESVQYLVDGRRLVVETGGRSFTRRCSEIQAQVVAALGQKRVVMYDKRSPDTTYVDPGFDLEFYLVAFVMACLAGGFGIAGLIATAIQRSIRKKHLVVE
jgi:hypothetical protein